MGILADRLDSLRIETSSPDGQITSEFRPVADVSIHFPRNNLHHYTERGLERQLSALADSWWTDYRRARNAAVAEATGEPAVEYRHWDTPGRRHRDERDQTGCEGMSDDHNVHISCTGLRNWRVLIRDGALSALDETEFAAEVSSAYAATMRDFHLKLGRLRAKHYPR